MIKKIPLLVAAILFVSGLAFVYTSNCDATTSICKKLASAETIENQPTTEETVQLAANYFEYSAKVLAEAQSQSKVVLYFWAPWCTSCASLDIELQEKKAQIPDGIIVLRINYDEAKELKQIYSVVTQHTFVQIDKSGNPVSTWVGGDIENFAKYIK